MRLPGLSISVSDSRESDTIETHRGRIRQRVQVVLAKRVGGLDLAVSRFLLWRAVVPKDGRIDPVSGSQGTSVKHHVREGTDPVIIDRPIRFQLAMP